MKNTVLETLQAMLDELQNDSDDDPPSISVALDVVTREDNGFEDDHMYEEVSILIEAHTGCPMYKWNNDMGRTREDVLNLVKELIQNESN